eukprot:TRINITY_DN5698_c0_g1_i1.p1 TRINITY_DN5698_c0_g1~~TRINITY_DN5698_c0_g1_i1.p1  ORF type:complete len:105 (+),score=25.62 TRINITY_DN5698_c0_g1_i1:63-377(+)
MCIRDSMGAGANTFIADAHVGTNSSKSKPQEITLDLGEHIVEITGNSGDLVDRVKIVTNKGKTLECGGKGGNPFENLCQGGRAYAFAGATNGHLHNLTVICKKL